MNFYEAWQAMLNGKKITGKHPKSSIFQLTYEKHLCHKEGEDYRHHQKIICSIGDSNFFIEDFLIADIDRFMNMEWMVIELTCQECAVMNIGCDADEKRECEKHR